MSKDSYFFDQLAQHFGHQFPFSDLNRYLPPPSAPELSLERTVFYETYLKKLLELLKIPHTAGSPRKELRPIFHLIHKIDPRYFTESSLSEEIVRCYPLTPPQQAHLLKHLVVFFNALGSLDTFHQKPMTQEGWKPWLGVFPAGHHWELLQMFQDLGERVVASWQGYRAWHRFHHGKLPFKTDEPLPWQEICQAWAEAHHKEAIFPDLLSHAFAGGFAHLGMVGYCGNTPDCLHCPIKSDCRWNQSLSHASNEGLEVLIQKQQFPHLLTAELVAWIFNLEESDASRLREIFSRESSLRSFDQKSLFELQQMLPAVEHFGEKLKALLELGKRYNEAKLTPGDAFGCSADIFQHFRFRLRDLKQECFILVLLDNKHQYLKETVVTKGILNKSLVHPREVFGAAIENRAAAIVCAHNHPSGDPKASPEDIQITQRLSDVGEIVGIPLLDHVIIGNDRYVSLADEGLL